MTGIRRALLPVLLAAAALACAFAIERSLACPVRLPPQPLRTLYRVSERVVVARVGAKEVLSTEDSFASARVALHVTENVKGPPVQLVHFHHSEYVGEDVDELEEAISFSSGRRLPRLKQGERYLFFLDPREGGGYTVNDKSYAVKELSDDDLKVYLERLKELAEITRRQPEDKLAVAEWLVRCAEQPATRWEGTYELLASAQAAARGDSEAKAPDVKEVNSPAPAEALNPPAAAEAQAAPEPQASAPPVNEAVSQEAINRLPLFDGLRDTRPDPELVPLLNAVQKQRLADAFFATPDPKEGDDELMQLVKDFADPRFNGFVLARLHRVEEEAPEEAELWLSTLAASLKNERLIELADSYTQNATYYEDEETPEAETRTDAAAEAVSETVEAEAEAEEAEEEPVDPEVEAAREAAAVERATRKRSALLKSLLSRIDLFVSTGQLAAN